MGFDSAVVELLPTVVKNTFHALVSPVPLAVSPFLHRHPWAAIDLMSVHALFISKYYIHGIIEYCVFWSFWGFSFVYLFNRNG